jgi:hypothetical protein
LRSLVRDQIIIALGGGGRGDPHRYFLHPHAAVIMCGKQEFDALSEAYEAEAKEHVRSNSRQ